MLEAGRWDYHIKHYESLKDNRIYNERIQGMNKSEHSEYMDLKHRYDECFEHESGTKELLKNTRITKKMYA